MKTVDTTVNISMKYPVTEKKLSEIIKTGKIDTKYFAHIIALFTDVPVPDFMVFIKKYGISLSTVKKFYFKHIKKFYSNNELENIFTFK